ncbi:MAG: hypothetical protein RL595_2743 [Planctomycetota bacterium]|jgi:purine-binding chemotaxis protein CheW
MKLEQSFATFFIDEMLFGIRVKEVQEILRTMEVTRVPLAPKASNGLMNLRGNIVLAVNLRRLLGLPAANQKTCMNIVLKHEEEFYSLQVDSVGDVISTEEDDFEPVPETIPEEIRHLLQGAYKLKDRLLLVMDVKSVFEEKTLLGRERTNEVHVS